MEKLNRVDYIFEIEITVNNSKRQSSQAASQVARGCVQIPGDIWSLTNPIPHGRVH